MNISVDKKSFVDAVSKSFRIAGKQQTSLPVLSCIVIVAGDDGIKVRATNLEIGVECAIPGTVAAEGVVAIPSSILAGFTNTLRGTGSITIEKKGDTVSIKDGKARTTIKTVSPDDFPTLPKVEGTPYTISYEKLLLGFRSVTFSASPSLVRPELAGIYLYVEGENLVFVATDSFRLSEKKVPVPGMQSFPPSIINAKIVQDLLKALEGSETVNIVINEHQCAGIGNGVYVTARLTEGTFPQYREIIPKEYFAHATALSADVLHALRSIAVFSDTFNKVRFSILPKKKECFFEAQNSEAGETIEPIESVVEGDDVILHFNHRYLSDVLPIITTDSITFSSAGEGRPLVIKGTGDSSFLYLVMPMNR